MRKHVLVSALSGVAAALTTFLLAPGVWSQQPRLPLSPAAVSPRTEFPAIQKMPSSQFHVDPKVLVDQLETRVAALEKRVAKLEAYKAKLATHEHGYLSPYGKRNTDGPEPGPGRGPGLGE
jgi:hypothetical protein